LTGTKLPEEFLRLRIIGIRMGIPCFALVDVVYATAFSDVSLQRCSWPDGARQGPIAVHRPKPGLFFLQIN
jgi:hypothetical protein